MKPLRLRMDQACRKQKIQLSVLETDYVLSWALAGISSVPQLRNNLIFKGGTALKKCYFGDYRFSEDLDFSALPDLPRRDQLLVLLHKACESGQGKANEFAPIELHCERYEEKNPHPSGQEAFKVTGKLPWHKRPLVPILVEIATDEPILDAAQDLAIIHGYEEPLSSQVLCYSLNEIVMEKLRGLLQYKAKLEGQRGWAKSRCRDYYDLWRIFDHYSKRINPGRVAELFPKKCDVRKVAFSGPSQFFEKILVDHARENWTQSLRDLVPGALPPFDDIEVALKSRLGSIFD